MIRYLRGYHHNSKQTPAPMTTKARPKKNSDTSGDTVGPKKVSGIERFLAIGVAAGVTVVREKVTGTEGFAVRVLWVGEVGRADGRRVMRR